MGARSFEQLAARRRRYDAAQRASTDPRNTDVRYAYEQIRSLLRNGPVADGELLESRLVAELGAGRNAIRSALRRLTAEGLLDRSPKLGTQQRRKIVQIRLDEPVPAEGLTVHRLGAELTATPARLTAEFGVTARRALVVEQLGVLGDEPVYRRVGCLPVHGDATGLPDRAEEYLRELAGCGTRVRIEAVAADPEMASDLGVEPGRPLILRELVRTGEQGTVREVSYTHFRGDRIAVVEESRQ